MIEEGPTLHLRFVEREVIVPNEGYATAVTRTILQQFWAHPEGPDLIGNMFKDMRGKWRDVPFVGREL